MRPLIDLDKRRYNVYYLAGKFLPESILKMLFLLEQGSKTPHRLHVHYALCNMFDTLTDVDQ